MTNTMHPDEYKEVERFANSLTKTFTNKMLNSKEPFEKIVLDYVIKVIDVHLGLANIEMQRYINEMAVHYGK